ncbi:C4-dicarboxylate transporter family protein, DctQ subunit [Parvularcula bermudensis HTCC2503]|uniref:TRAP transporter small permease protein n=1 Tax=Parvularcula bermudensis (strain ATCC BAA-594 / HTCC2503 / KCTC 12087) TaxID=314260 RepID=E0TH98_PARBH|nr:TRAP transporter small permease subunit [Parvularcula bermudensis]ADM10188.1 C4-dicarboxylate transporter family protein, DctQ subunit [Parvularcula bermudensis HTCC2503]
MTFALAAILGLVALAPLTLLVSLRLPGLATAMTLSRWLLKIGFGLAAAAALFIAMAQLGAVVTRNIFGINFIWLQESAVYFFGLMVLLAPAAMIVANSHVRVDIFYTDWSERRKRIIDLVGLHLFVLPVALLIVSSGTPYALKAWQVLEGSPEPSGLPAVFLLKTLVPTFGVLLALAVGVRSHDLLTGKGRSTAARETI